MAGTRTIHDADALLLYRVGPVYCCSPTMPVVSVQLPPRLNHPPGSNVSRPGVFKFASGIVRVVDLRQCFGVDQEDREHPGKIVVTEVAGGLAGFWVDEIIDVIQCPRQGWGRVPAMVPRDVFTRTLLFNDHIQLYAEFEKFNDFRETGYLRQHIQALKSRLQTAEKAADKAPSPAGSGVPLAGAAAQADKEPADDSGMAESATSVDKAAALNEHQQAASSDIAVPNQSSAAAAGEAVKQRPAASSSTVPGQPSAGAPTGGGPGQANQRVADRTGSQRPSKSSASISRTVSPAPAQPARQPSIPPRPDPQPVARDNTAAVMEQPARADYGLWALLAMLLVLVVVGAYLFSDSGQQLAAPQTGRPQQMPAPVKPVELNKDANSDDRSAMSPPMDVVEPQASRQATSLTATADSDRPPAEQVQQTQRSAAIDKQESEPSVPLLSLPGEVPVVDDSWRQAYRATINKDDEGLVIVVDAPQDEPLMNPATDTTAAGDDSAGSEQQEQPAAGDEPAAENTGQSGAPAVTEPAVEATTETAAGTSTAQPNGSQLSRTIVHVVVRGDTLWHIARRYIHNPYRYPELARLSKIKNPDLIYPGDRVKIIINKTRRN